LYYAAKIKWDTLPGTGKSESEIFIEAMKDKNPHIREMAVQALGNSGGAGALESVISATRETDYNVRESAIFALKKITGRLLIEDYYFVCQKCLLRYKHHEAKIPSYESITYCACPKCHGDSQYWVGIKKIVLLLDRNFKESCIQKEETLIVNWFKRGELFDHGDLTDYDEIRLENTDDYQVEKLLMILRNDMNDKKRERLPEIPVRLSPRLKLSQAKINMLKDNFKTVINQ
jgi:hypothetical protein